MVVRQKKGTNNTQKNQPSDLLTQVEFIISALIKHIMVEQK